MHEAEREIKKRMDRQSEEVDEMLNLKKTPYQIED